ncbi:MAG TPA: hypothetical protein VH280_02435 [Verrucomicrobiae bacterium]|jgi:hypothetical protein|nr:hypothetical protein [Verrucomicrobiae bacterium]
MIEKKNLHSNAIHLNTVINRTWSPTAGKFDFTFVFTFRNKEEYLAFRWSWKENYAALSGKIRNQKREIKAIQRKLEYAGQLQSKVCELKREATVQIFMLRAAKQEANRQYQQAKQAGQ